MSHKKSVLSFSSMRLDARFGILLGGMAVVALVLFVVYSVYAQRSAEDQFVGQGRVLTNALALQVNFDMIMGDDEGMIERLDVLLEGGAVKGGIFRDSKGSEVTAKGLEGELRRAKAPVDDVVWETDANDNRVLVATTSVINQANGESLGTVTLVLPADRLDQQRRASIGVALAISALLVLMGLALLVIVRRTVVRPVDGLRLAAGRVASGDLTAQVDVVGRARRLGCQLFMTLAACGHHFVEGSGELSDFISPDDVNLGGEITRGHAAGGQSKLVDRPNDGATHDHQDRQAHEHEEGRNGEGHADACPTLLVEPIGRQHQRHRAEALAVGLVDD